MQSLLSNARVFKYFYVIKTIFARHILCIISLFTCITKWYTSQILDLRFNLYDMPTLDSLVVYHILLVSFFFFNWWIRFDLLDNKIKVLLWFLHFTYGFEFNLYPKIWKNKYVQDHAKIRMFFRENFVIN